MNKIERMLYDRLVKGDPQLRELFEQYVRNLGHTSSEAEQIVESIVTEGRELLSDGLDLASLAKFDSKEVL